MIPGVEFGRQRAKVLQWSCQGFQLLEEALVESILMMHPSGSRRGEVLSVLLELSFKEIYLGLQATVFPLQPLIVLETCEALTAV